MPICCRCNRSGHCLNCSCVKRKRQCVDCLPSRLNSCRNIAPTFFVSSQPSSVPSVCSPRAKVSSVSSLSPHSFTVPSSAQSQSVNIPSHSVIVPSVSTQCRSDIIPPLSSHSVITPPVSAQCHDIPPPGSPHSVIVPSVSSHFQSDIIPPVSSHSVIVSSLSAQSQSDIIPPVSSHSVIVPPVSSHSVIVPPVSAQSQSDIIPPVSSHSVIVPSVSTQCQSDIIPPVSSHSVIVPSVSTQCQSDIIPLVSSHSVIVPSVSTQSQSDIIPPVSPHSVTVPSVSTQCQSDIIPPVSSHSVSIPSDAAILNYLPHFSDMNTSDVLWSKNVSCHEFQEAINAAYMEIVHWRPNLFMLPSGSVGKCFVKELSSLFNAFSTSSAYEAFAITAAMSMPALLLQKPHAKSKARDHIAYLEKRLTLWKKGDIKALLAEAKVIQSRLSSNSSSQNNATDRSRVFSDLMKKGKVRAALQRLSKQSGNAILNMDDVIETSSGNSTVRQMLKVKHPYPQSVNTETIFPSGQDDLNLLQIRFDSITTEVIRDSALKTEGAAGPSGVDAMCWRRLCTAFGEASNDLCSALACTAKRICMSYIDPKSLTAYTACRLIPLNKNPGVRPIGIGEVVRRIIGKAVMKAVQPDL